MAAFYNQKDQDIYKTNKFMPQSRFLFDTPTDIPVEEKEKVTESFGIPQTQAFTNSGGNNSTGYNFGNTGFQQAVDARQNRLNAPTDTSTFLGRTMGKVKDFMNPQSASQIMTDGYQEPRFQPGIIGTIMSKMDNYRNLPRADQAFIAQNMGYTGPTVFGENNSGLGKDMYGINTRSMFGNYANYVDEMEADYSKIDKAAYAKLSKFQQKKIDFYREKKKESDALKMQEKLAEEERKAGIVTLQERIDKEYKDSGGGQFNKSNDPTGSKEKGFNMHGDGKMADGGRAGYFFGGRVDYKAGGRIRFQGGGRDAGKDSDFGSEDFGGDKDDNREQYGAVGQYSTGPTLTKTNDGGVTKPVFYDKNDNIITTDFISKNPNFTINYTDPRNYASLKSKIGFNNILDNDDITAEGDLTGKFGPVSYNTNFTDKGITGTNLTAGKFNANLNPDMQVQNMGYSNNINGINYGVNTDFDNTMFTAGVNFKNGGLAGLL